MARKKKTSNLFPPEQSQPASSANSVKSDSSRSRIGNWFSGFGAKFRTRSDKTSPETCASQSQPSLSSSLQEPATPTVPLPAPTTRRAQDPSSLKDFARSQQDITSDAPVDLVLLSSSSVPAENVCLGTSSKTELPTAPSRDINSQVLPSSAQIPQITLIPSVQVNPLTVSRENIAKTHGPSTGSTPALSIDTLQSGTATEEQESSPNVPATAISGPNLSEDIGILPLATSCSSSPGSVIGANNAPEPPSNSSHTVSLGPADRNLSKTLQLDKRAMDTKLAAIWSTTLEKANLKLVEYKLPLLDPDDFSCQAAGENIHYVLEDLKVAQEQYKDRQWKFTWNGKKIIVVERLEKILKSFQKYTGIVDTAIQHSPKVTALVWAGVRAMLQIMLAHIEAIKSFEAAIAEIMEKLAMCELYAGIYVGVDLSSEGILPNNIQKLQETMAEALPDLYVAVIVFTVKARTYFEAKWLKKLAYTLKTFELEVQPFIDDINTRERCMREYADTVTRERIKGMEGLLSDIKDELESISKLHKLSDVIQETHQVVLELREDAKMNTLLELLSPLEPLKRHQDIKTTLFADSGTWLLQLESYNKWCAIANHEDKNYHTLCCYGIPGAGKTFLSCIVIEDLKARFSHGFNIGIACIYSDYRDQSNQTLNHMLGSIVHQLLVTALPMSPPEAIEILQKIKKEKRQLEKEELLGLLRIALAKLDLTFICIDALDEQDLKIRLQLLQAFAGLGISTVRLFFTAREHVQSEIQARLPIPPQCEIKITANPEDLQKYLKQQIAEDTDPEAMDEELCAEIVTTILGHSNGMFLLPALHIQLVLDKSTKFQRRCALRALPDDLYTTFGKVVQRITDDRRHAELGMKVFMWLHFARRPLTLQELQDALAIVDGQERFDNTNIPSKKALLDCCCGLVTVDEETITVRFVHFSLEEYFREYSSQYFPNGRIQVAKACLDYLNCEQIVPTSDNLHLRLEEFPFLEYAASNWGYYVQQSGDCEALQDCAFKLLHHKVSHPPCAIQILYYAVLSPLRKILRSRWGNFRASAGIHVAVYFALSKLTVRLCETQGAELEDALHKTPLILAAEHGHESVVRLLLERDDVDVNRGNSSGRTPLSFAAQRGHKSVVRLLLERDDIDVHKDGFSHTPLSRAAQGGHESVVRLLLERDDVDVHKENMYSQTPLFFAAQGGHGSVVRLLLERNADVTKENTFGQTLLSHAARGGHESVVRLLLERHDGDVNEEDNPGHTPLSYAAIGGHESVVRLLLGRNDVDVNKGRQTPLISAASNGHESVVSLLLERDDVDVNKEDMYSRTPLSHAAQGGHESVVRLLLERDDVDVNKRDSSGHTPLFFAVLFGHESVVRRLLERDDVDINKENEVGRTPLSHAAEHGKELVVQLLLERDDVDVNKREISGRTPLYFAVLFGHESVMRRLLERNDVDVNKGDHTPLISAALYGHESVVRLLLERDDVDVNKEDMYSRTPLSHAAQRGHESVVRLLLERDDVEVNKENNSGHTPLYFAVLFGHESVVRRLLEKDEILITEAMFDILFWKCKHKGHDKILQLLHKFSNLHGDRIISDVDSDVLGSMFNIAQVNLFDDSTACTP